MAAVACLRGWRDLPPDLLALIAGGLPIQAYDCARAVCTAWRAALRPASPSSLIVRLDGHCLSAWCLSPRVSTVLHESLVTKLSPVSRCVGSSYGWVAVYNRIYYPAFGLVNPLTGEVIPFDSLPQRDEELVVFKVVFAPNPTPNDFTAAAITGRGRVTYTTDGNSRWTEIECPRLGHQDGIADVLYHERGGGERAVYCLTRSGDVHVLRLPAGRRGVFEPLIDEHNTVFDATVAFEPPYDTIRDCTGAKNLVVSDDGELYQIWRNDTCTRIKPLPDGGEYRVAKNQIFFLRYYPHRRPCWVAVEDLGGCSVFVGKNNSVALHVDGGGDGPGLRGNCVYWIDTSLCRDRAKVFDMKSGESAQFFPSVADHSAICWFFLGDARRAAAASSVATPACQVVKRGRHA